MERAFGGKLAAAVSSALRSTNILDLDEDCLRESFEYLDLSELAAVADVCTRFKHIAQTHFQTLKYKRINALRIYEEKGMLGVSKVLRNFGAYILSIDCDYFPRVESRVIDPQKWLFVEREFIKLACRYCIGTLQELKRSTGYLDDDLAQMMLPLMSQLKKLKLILCDSHGHCLKLLPQLNNLKLEELILHVFDSEFIFIDKLLQKCPDLKKVAMQFNGTYSGIFTQAIAKHHPLIENISLINGKIFTDLGKLSKLNTVHIHCSTPVLGKTVGMLAEAPLEHLKISGTFAGANQFVNNITKLKKLKTLAMAFVEGRVRCLSVSHVIEILKNLPELSEFEWIYAPYITVQKLIEMVKKAQTLKYFYCSNDSPGLRFDGNTFSQLVDIVKKRPQHNYLEVVCCVDSLVLDVPDDLAGANKETLTLSTIPKFSISTRSVNRYIKW